MLPGLPGPSYHSSSTTNRPVRSLERLLYQLAKTFVVPTFGDEAISDRRVCVRPRQTAFGVRDDPVLYFVDQADG